MDTMNGPVLRPGLPARHSRPRAPRKRRLIFLAALAGLAVIVTGAVLLTQAGGGHAAASVRACRDYLAQGAAARKVAKPTLDDVARWASQVKGDAAEAAPGSQLERDLAAWSADPASANTLIRADCSAIGVS